MSHLSLTQTLDAIERQIHEKLCAQTLAGNAFFSKYHYQRLFREAVGENVMEYVKKRKLSLAGGELLETELTVLEIALRYGYGSHESFTRAFKAYMGVTPLDYRRYGLSAISKKPIEKERAAMQAQFENQTEEIIRGLNGWIADARTVSGTAKRTGVPAYADFWEAITRKTDSYADQLEQTISRITAVSSCPDEITNRFSILKILEDIAFFTNVLSFHIRLTVSRGSKEDMEKHNAICKSYEALANSAVNQTRAIAKLLRDLAAGVFEDILQKAEKKASEVCESGKKAALELERFSHCSYIKDEVEAFVHELSQIPPERLNACVFENFSFRMEIILFNAETDVFRCPADKGLLDALMEFHAAINDAQSYFAELPEIRPEEPMKTDVTKCLEDIAFQGNIYYFYTKGEIEKANALLSSMQKQAFQTILAKLNGFIQLTRDNCSDAAKKSLGASPAFTDIADALAEIQRLLEEQAELMGEKGGVIRFLASEIKLLTEKVLRVVEYL